MDEPSPRASGRTSERGDCVRVGPWLRDARAGHARHRGLFVRVRRGSAGDSERGAPRSETDSVDRAVVGLLVQRTAGRQTCSGTLIAANLVATARHCISESPPDSVRCGHAPLGAAVPPAAIDVTTTLTTDHSLPDDGGAHHAVTAIDLAPGGDDACGMTSRCSF